MVAVGYGDGSGGAREVGDTLSVGSCAMARVQMARRGMMVLIDDGIFIRLGSIVDAMQVRWAVT